MEIAIVKRGLITAAVLTALAPVACGSDSSKSTDQNNQNKNDKSTSGEDAGTKPSVTPPGAVACGEKNCTSPEGSTAKPCCLSAFESTCGVLPAFGGGCAAAPPPPPPECPMLPSLGPITLGGCCTDMGLCGVDFSAFGMGCTDYATVNAMAARYSNFDAGMPGAMFGGMFPKLPAEANCTKPASM